VSAGALPALARSRLLRLRDGRALCWAEWGDPGGAAVIEFHGNPGCRLLAWAGEEVVAAAGVRLLSFDRAGIGLSDPAPGRSVAASASDPLELAGALGLERFGVLGYSLGGAYAAGLAAAAPERVGSLALVSAVVPLGELGGIAELGHAGVWRAARRAPRALALAYRAIGAVARRWPGLPARLTAAGLSGPDRAILARAPVRARLAPVAVEAGRHGGHGTVEDMRAAMRPWGFRLDRIAAPTSVWQGTDDVAIPTAWGERLAGGIPGAELRLLPGEGHCLIEDRLAEILAGTAAALRE
jgi:pimeloyl-ACP methyl ester carboxylesterase